MMNDKTTPAHGNPVSLEDVLFASSVTGIPELERTRLKAVVMSSIRPQPLRSARLVFARAATVFACCGTLVGGVSFAAAHSLPGDPLYPLRQAAQEMRIVFTPQDSRGDALIDLSDTRAEEVRMLMQVQAGEARIQKAVDGFGDAAGRAVESAPDSPTAQQRAKRIEDAVSDEPVQVRERVQSGIPETGSGGSAPSVPSGPKPSGSGAGTTGSSDAEPVGSGNGSGAAERAGSGSGSTSQQVPVTPYDEAVTPGRR
ncbi:MAG: hypothetical protein KJ747_06545 [Actinobacteria bacterium]|nr:hypothetical protein [Actinomycetota bacterium]MCG2807460.1 hypothetical protein [Coriobacteriia bacterium]